MAHKRVTSAAVLPGGNDLTAAMAGIGMAFASPPAREPNIEDTLVAASIEGVEHDDLRVVAVLGTWLEVHHPWINADRLARAVREIDLPRVRAFWAAVAVWLGKDRRFSALERAYGGPVVDLLRVGTEFQIRRKGEDARFSGTSMRVPEGVLRDRKADVLSPSELARRHRTYRCRVLMGASYRADMWAALERDPGLSAAALARRAYGSFATAWRVKRDFGLLARRADG
jgi:hypothetical protein